jgi:serine/threonine protein phosphatase PrpC
MGFFRKLFRGSQPEQASEEGSPAAEDAAPGPASAPEEAPEEAPGVPPPVPAPALAAEVEAEAAWWSESTPPDEQSAAPTVSPPAPAPAERSNLGTAPLYMSDDPADAEHDAETPWPDSPTSPAALAMEEPSEEQIERAGPDATRQLGDTSAPQLAQHRSAQGLAAAALRDVGRVRQINQDSVYALLTTLPREGADIPLGLFVVADGMGGHEGGEVASRLAVGSVARHVLGQVVVPALDDRPIEALQTVMVEAIEEANRTIWDHAQAVGSDMGTTCTAVLLLGSALYIGHVGDSRAYINEAGDLRPLTTDHSAVGRLIQMGQLEPSEAREHPLRNQLYRTVGQHQQVQVDFVYQPLGAGTHLLLGSDGLWGMLDEAQMAQTLGKCIWPQDACAELVALANLAGGEDNISVVVVSLYVAERGTA